VVEATLRALAVPFRLVRASVRVQLRWGGVAADVFAIVCAYAVAVAVRALAMSAIGQPVPPFASYWSVVLLVGAELSVFHVLGLYDLEVYASRPLHLWVLAKATLGAFAATALSAYVIKLDAFDEPRLVLLLTLVLFVLLDCALRFGVLDGLYMTWVRRQRPVTFVLGDSPAVQALAENIGRLRGFDRVEPVRTAQMRLGLEGALKAMQAGTPSADGRAVMVFIDALGGTPRDVFETVASAQTSGAEVYVVGRLLNCLAGNGLLSALFDAPVVRVRRSFAKAEPYLLKRAFDVVGSALLLLLFLPVVAVLGVVIRLTSPGPVIHKQTRIGRSGTPFEFLKLRSMIVDGDASIHSDYVRAFMNGTAEAVAVGVDGQAVFKRIDDPRITRIGRFIRKYSLDELPQFWNVFRGDMSLVGPRPALPYEVSEYDDWHSLRLTVPPGVTGCWQCEGRSRVSFDEMILQDLMYAQNMRLLLDIELCLRTVPATLLGHGGG